VEQVLVEPVQITRVDKRGECYHVEGVVKRRGNWLKASFTAHASDVEHMNRTAFESFCSRQLPHMTEDVDWRAPSM
jgi:hypothetical protein